MAMYEIGFRIGSTVGGAISGIKSVGSALSDLQARSKKINESIGKFGSKQSEYGGKLVKEAMAIGATVGAFVYPAMKVDKDLINIRKGMGEISDIDFSSFKSDLFSLGDEVPQIGLGFTTVAKGISQAGVSGKENILSLTKTIGKLGYSFELAGEQATSMSLKIIDTYKLSASSFGDIADVLNMFSNNETQKLLDISQTMSGIGSDAQGFGLNAKETAAFSTVGLSTGQDSGKVTAAFNSFFQKLNNLDGQGKEFHNALNSIGLSKNAIKAGQKIDPAQAAIDVLARVANFDKDTQVQMMSFFGDSNGVLKDMLKEIPTLRSQLARVRDTDSSGKTAYSGSLDGHFEMMSSTTMARMDTFKNTIVKLSVIIGESLLPPLQSLMDTITPVIIQFGEWARANPELIQQGIKIAGVVVGMRLGFLALNFGVFGVIKNILQITAGFTKAWGIMKIGMGIISSLGGVLGGVFLTSLKLVGHTLLWVGRAMLFNPVGLAITIIAIPFLIFKYWEPIKGFFQDLWMNIKAFFSSGIGNISRTILNWSPMGLFYKVFAKVLSWFGVDLPEDFTGFGQLIISNFTSSVGVIWEGAKSIFNSVVDYIRDPFDALPMEMQTFGVDIIEAFVGSINTKWEVAKAIFTTIIDFIKDPFGSLKESFTGYGENIIDGVVGGLNNKLSSAKESIIKVGNSIKGWFTSVLGIKSPSRVFMGFGENITEGAAIGIEKGLPKAKNAVDKLNDEMQLTSSLLGSKSGSGSVSTKNSEVSGGITIHFAPTINAADVTGVKEALNIGLQELERKMKEIMRQNQRRSFT